MNRRQFLGSVVGATASGVVLADCRDHRNIIQPDGDSINCIDLTFNRSLVGGSGQEFLSAVRGEFHFGAYEELLKHKKSKKKYAFTFEGANYRMRVTSVDIDVNRAVGCVTCVVYGALFS
jgi:hypothetical protein